MATEDTLGIVVMLLAATGGGLWLIWKGFKLRRQRELIEETPTADIESVSIGPAELVGTATPDGEPITAPFTDEDCLVARWEVEEWEETDDDSHWKTVDSGVDVTPFVLDDGTGTIRVDASHAAEFEIRRGGDETRRVNVDTEEPAAISEFLNRGDTVGDAGNLLSAIDMGNQEGDRRYTQNLLKPGQEAYVYGAVRSDGDPETPLTLGTPTNDVDSGMFMISDLSEERLLERRNWALLWRLPVGALLTAFGVGGLYLILSGPA